VRAIEIEDLEEFDERAAGATSMRGWQLQDLDLTGREQVLAGLDPSGALLLGCTLSPDVEDDLRRRGALVFPTVPDVPFDAYRSHLYTAAELYDGLDAGYDHTPDARVYVWSLSANHPRLGGTSMRDSLAMALHDNAIDDALAEYVDDRRIVGVMGGHDLSRADPAYADAARLGAELVDAGLTVATGGGPGAMEAANLGARFPDAGDALTDALAAMAQVPAFKNDIGAWARRGIEVAATATDAGHSLGIPTWFYGHEPPNPFPDRIAKYFRNAIREDILLRVCNAGIVFLPGAAGTVQEIFQAACENYYAPPGQRVRFVFVGTAYWTEELAVWPLLRSLGVRAGFDRCLTLLDRTDEVAAALGQEL